MHKLRHELFEIQLDIGVVLVRRDTQVAPHTVAILVEFVAVEQYTSRRLDGCRTLAGLRLYGDLLLLEALGKQRVDDLDRLFDDVCRLDKLGNAVHKRIAAALFQTEHSGNLFG